MLCFTANIHFLFYILFTVNLGTILANNQLDAIFQCIYLFYLSTCFEQHSAHHQEIDLLIYHLVCISLCK
jgi:hypothetical protein